MKDLYDELKRYTDSGAYPFHMPGHKRSGAVSFGDPFLVDITEIDGFDNLHHPEGILREAEAEAARQMGSLRAFFQVNGSSGALLSAIYAAADPGDEILLVRNCHKAVYNGVCLRGLVPHYLYPERDSETGIAGPVTKEQVEAALKKWPKVRAVVLVSPNYEGVAADITDIAQVIREKDDTVLIVDEAHGAHLPFCRGLGFPDTALDGGADLVIQSLHKTMPALTQTGLLHRNSRRVSEKRLQEAAGIFQTSSPSYVLLASIVRAFVWAEENKGAFLIYKERLDKFRKRAESWRWLRLFDGAAMGWHQDPGKLVVYDRTGRLSGRKIYDRLRLAYRLQPEMCTERYVVLMTSPADRAEGFERLEDALEEIDRSEAFPEDSCQNIMETAGKMGKSAKKEKVDFMAGKPAPALPVMEQVMTPGEASGKPARSVSWAEAVGSVAGEYLYLYPPEIPILVPGERIVPELANCLSVWREAGLAVQGPEKEDRIRVLMY